MLFGWRFHDYILSWLRLEELKYNRKMKTAIVCDWITGWGGAERVVQAVHEMYPDAPIYTSQYDKRKIDWFKDADVRTGWLNGFPKFLKKLLPFFRCWYFSHLDLSEYDLIISITGAEAKAVKRKRGATHVCYLHAPTQYYWGLYDKYMKDPGFGMFNFLMRFGLKVSVGFMRRLDFKYAQRPDVIVVNSEYIKAETKKYYKRNAVVVAPPVNYDFFSKKAGSSKKREGYVATGRQVSWKRFDLAVNSCRELERKLTLIGSGPEHRRLRELADRDQDITFISKTDDKGIREALSGAQAFLFPSKEPFGIAAVEALACGTPVIAFAEGGSKDFVTNKNGVLFEEQSKVEVVAAMRKLEEREYDSATVSKTAEKFSEENFVKKFGKVIEDATNK